MAKQIINVGSLANDKTGDALRTAFGKTNANFTELYTAIDTIPTDVSDLTDSESLLGGGGSGDTLTNDAQTFSLDVAGNAVFSGEIGGVNRGLVWDYGAETGGENSTVRQDNAGLSVRAWTEVLDNEELYSAPVNIVTNEAENEKIWTFDGDGLLSLPDGGSITEGVVTDNPTIELTPANPDVESQKLVIKGGGGYYAEANGIWINLSNVTFQVGDTVTAYVGSETYAEQTLYWWIVPEESGISDPGFGTVTLDESGLGNFSFEVDNEDEFTVRVSQVENVYDPTTGVESLTINGDIGDHHLHLTTGDLAETSIFLGTDDHNVRTTIDGEIQITTPNESNNVWRFGSNGDLELPDNGGIVFDRANTSIRVGMGFHVASGEGVSIEAIDETDPDNLVYKGWHFGTDGSITFPDSTIQPSAAVDFGGQQTVYVNATTATDGLTVSSLTGTVVLIIPELGYTEANETHAITLPTEGIQVGTRITVINAYNGTIDLSGWFGPPYTINTNGTVNLILIDGEGSLGWWVTSEFYWSAP
jgi:hypothetical protein